MWLTLLLTILLIGITIRQAMQGFFSALILAVLAICCSAAALGNYEWVAATWVAPMLWPDHALPIALAGLFGIPLMISYAVFVTLFKRACVLPVLMDRVGGGICGVISAMIIVGIAGISLQLIPFNDGEILGFVRIPVVRVADVGSADEPAEEAGLLLGPDAFAVSLVSVLSHGVFSTDDSFSETHPNMLRTIGWVGAAPEQVSRFAPPGSISIVGSEPLQFVYEMTPGDVRSNAPPTYEPQQPPPGTEFREVTVKLGDAARDKDRSHFFTLRQFRLVGRERDRVDFDQYHPIAIQQSDASDSTNRHVRYNRRAKPVPVYDEVYRPRDGEKNTVEIVFELPEGFRPSFLEYKHEARAAVSFAPKPDSDPQTRATPTAPPTRTASTEPSATAPPSSRRGRRRRAAGTSGSDNPPARRGSNVRGVATVEGRSRFSDELPVKLTAYRRLQNADIQRGALASGHLVAELDQQEAGSDPPVGKFFVPDDKRLLQLSTQKLQARSGLGRALSFAVGTLQNYTVMDAKGNQFVVVGKYATANVNGVDVFEVVYFSGPTGRTGGLGKFDRINEKRDLKPTDDFVLLFLVDPGAEIVSFSSGGAASRKDDLVAEKLIAPQ